MPSPRVITTPSDLAKYVFNILGSAWSVDVIETSRTEICHTLPVAKRYYWMLHVTCPKPMEISVYLHEKTLAALVKAADRDLWEKIREEFEKKSVQWQRPAEPGVIEDKKRRLGVKRPAIEHKQAALTHQPAALTHQPKQLLLLAPEPRCNWPGCDQTISPKAWACTQHWQALPHQAREKIIDLYRPGEGQSVEFITFTADLKAQIKRYPALFKIKD
jgi:hypothetical protein